MADNFTTKDFDGVSITGASDDIGGVNFPRVKLIIGSDGTNDGDVATGNPLPVVQTGTLVLPAGASTSAKQDTGNNSIASVDTKMGEVQASPTSNTLLARLKDLLTGIVLSAGSAIIGKVGIDQTTPGTTNAVQANAGTNLNTSTLSTSLKQSDGSQKTQVVDGAGNVIGSTSNAIDINIKSGSIPSGSNLIGKIGIDQTTPGTTNAVAIKVIDTNGTPQSLIIEDGVLAVRQYLQAMAEGDIAQHVIFEKIGYSPASSGSQTTLWNPGTQYVFPASAIQMEAVSSSANDASAGTGARTMMLSYLDNTYAEHTEEITLNGTTPVLTVATNILRVNSWYVNTVGSGYVSAGTISMRNATDHTTIYSQCAAGYTRNRSSVYTVPLGKTLYITDLSFSAGYSTVGKQVRMTLHGTMTPLGTLSAVNLFYPLHEIILMDSNYPKPLGVPIKVLATADIKVSVIGETNAVCTSYVAGWLE